MFDRPTLEEFFFDSEVLSPAMEAWEEYDEEQLKEHQKINAEYKKKSRNSYVIQNYLLPIVDGQLKNSSKERQFIKQVAAYTDRNVDILSSPFFTKNMIFTQRDEDIVFSIFEVDKKELKQKIKEMPKPGSNSGFVNVTPFRVLMLFIIGHYARTKEYKKMEYAYRYYAYSQFYTLFYSVGFRKGVIKPEAMAYAIDNMDNKFYLKKYGSIDATIIETMKTTVENYLKGDRDGKPNLLDLNDFAVLQIIMAFKSRQASWMKKVFSLYKEAVDKGYGTTEKGEEFDEETGDVIERATASGAVQSLADKYTADFFTSPLSPQIIRIVIKRCDVSESEIRGVLEKIIESHDRENVNRLYSAMFQSFFDNNPKFTEKDVHSAVFGARAEALFRKTNQDEPLVYATKTITTKWLEQGSNIYRGSTRLATKASYRRAVFLYFVFCVIWNK